VRSATAKSALVVWAYPLAWALVACAGKELLDLGGDAAADAGGDAVENEDAFPPPTPVGVFPCGPSVCTSPEVCCEQFGAVPQCEARGQCTGLAVGCDALSCPDASLCCESVDGYEPPPNWLPGEDAGHVTGFTQCIQGASCPAGMNQACASNADCPPTEGCGGGAPLFFPPYWCVPGSGPDAGSVDARGGG
jgi:hypothetical protein